MYCFYEQTNVHKRWFYYLYLNRFSDSHSVIEYRVTFSVSIVIFRTNNSSLQGSLLWLLSNFSWEWEKSKNNVTNWPMAIADVKCHCIDFIRSHNSIKKTRLIWLLQPDIFERWLRSISHHHKEMKCWGLPNLLTPITAPSANHSLLLI